MVGFHAARPLNLSQVLATVKWGTLMHVKNGPVLPGLACPVSDFDWEYSIKLANSLHRGGPIMGQAY
jgi:hypothetical protein